MALEELLTGRIAGLALHPDIARALLQLSLEDSAYLARCPHVVDVIPTVQRAFEGARTDITPFRTAWLLMYAAITRLDQLQDGDPMHAPLPVATTAAAQYNLVFGFYLLAASLLDELGPTVAPDRAARLRRFWTDSMLRMAAGQQRDLALAAPATETTSFEDYQQLVQAKTGATFALAFGGTAMLLTDDRQVIEALTHTGEIYGTLLQYSDDLLDAAQQPNDTATLPRLLDNLPLPQAIAEQGHAAFWAYMYEQYRAAAEAALVPLWPRAQQQVLRLFARTFESEHSRTPAGEA